MKLYLTRIGIKKILGAVGLQYTVPATDNKTTKTTNTSSYLPCHAGTYKDDIAHASWHEVARDVQISQTSHWERRSLQGHTAYFSAYVCKDTPPSPQKAQTLPSRPPSLDNDVFDVLEAVSSQGMYPCSLCPIGTYSIVPVSTACLPYVPGRFSDETARSRCMECTAGTYTDVSDSHTSWAMSTGLLHRLQVAGAANSTVQCVGLTDARPFEEKNREIVDLKSQLSSLQNTYQHLETDHKHVCQSR